MNSTKPELIRLIQAEWLRALGRRYQVDLEALDVQSLRELTRLNRDFDFEARVRANKARMMPWRRV